MSYTVNKLAKLAGISVRTLHYYDEIGLLNPSYQAENGYRYYEEAELLRLQQILFFRELDFSLEKIRSILDAPDFDRLVALRDQKVLLTLRREKIERLLATIEETIKSVEGGEYMSHDDTFSAFNDPTYQKHKDEVEKRWGETDAYKQSIKRVGKMSAEELEQVKAEQEEISRESAALMQQGYASNSPEVQQQVERFYNHLRRFYEPSYELFRGLGQMYVDDPRFTAVYEKRAEGFAVFMRDAMKHYADTKEGK